MNKDALLRKSGVAIRKSTTPKKRNTRLPKPPTQSHPRNSGKSVKRGRANYISEQESESENDSQPLATRRVGGKLPLASLPEIQAGPTNESTEQMDFRSDARNGASERMMLEKSEGEQNEGASTSAKGRASKKRKPKNRTTTKATYWRQLRKKCHRRAGRKSRRRSNDWSLTRVKTQRVTRNLENHAGKERR